MIRASLIALFFTSLATPAVAQDARLIERVYAPSEVVRIEGKAKVQATIKFGENENIENVAIGDSQAWQVTPNKRANLLFVKPLRANAVTNMTVVTNKRTYLFDLVASPRAKPLYLLSFSYPEEEAAKAAAEAEAAKLARTERANPQELAASRDPYAVLDPEGLNFAWTVDGDQRLLPERVFDNGEATFLNWSEGKSVPAILVVDEEGTEGPVNFTVRGDTVVVDGVPSQIILRSGEDRAVIVHAGPARPANDNRTPRGDTALAKNQEVK